MSNLLFNLMYEFLNAPRLNSVKNGIIYCDYHKPFDK